MRKNLKNQNETKEIKKTEVKIVPKESKAQKMYLYDMKKTDELTCLSCRKFCIEQIPAYGSYCTCRDKKNADQKFSFNQYHECIEPTKESMEAAVCELKEKLEADVLPNLAKVGAEFILDRLSGTDQEKACEKVKAYKLGPAFLERNALYSIADTISTKALAQYVKTDIAERKKLRTQRATSALLKDKAINMDVTEIKEKVVLDGTIYLVLTKDGNKAYITSEKEVDERRLDESYNNFRHSELRKYLNTEWLAKNPEVDKCLIDKVGLLTESDYRKYGKKIPLLKKAFWLEDHFPGNDFLMWAVQADGSTGILNVYYEDGFVRPAFWIDMTKLQFRKKKESSLDAELEALRLRFAAAIKDLALNETERDRILDDIQMKIQSLYEESGMKEEFFACYIGGWGLKLTV